MGQLPIHKVFQNLPPGSNRLYARQVETINVLMADSPETATLKDNFGNLPLHLATYYASSVDTTELIYNIYPSAALIRDGEGNLPINFATSEEIRAVLLRGSQPLLKVGIKGSFAANFLKPL